MGVDLTGTEEEDSNRGEQYPVHAMMDDNKDSDQLGKYAKMLEERNQIREALLREVNRVLYSSSKDVENARATVVELKAKELAIQEGIADLKTKTQYDTRSKEIRGHIEYLEAKDIALSTVVRGIRDILNRRQDPYQEW